MNNNSLSRVRQKLLIVQLVEFRAVYGIRRLITMFLILGQINPVKNFHRKKYFVYHFHYIHTFTSCMPTTDFNFILHPFAALN